MMNKKIIFGCLMSAFILIMLPSVSSFENKENLKANIFEQINEMNLGLKSSGKILGQNMSLTQILIIIGAIMTFVSGIFTLVMILKYLKEKKTATPEIIFENDSVNSTLKITSVSRDNVAWSDLNITGCCNASGLGEFVTVGDKITECSGKINITYIPNDEQIGYWYF